MSESSVKLSARGIITNDASEVLLLKRSANCNYNPGKWEFPGGKVERKYLHLRALRAVMTSYEETKQETGVDSIYPSGYIFTTHSRNFIDNQGIQKRHITEVVLGHAVTEEIVIDPLEVEEALWAPRQELRQYDLTEVSRAAAYKYGSVMLQLAG